MKAELVGLKIKLFTENSTESAVLNIMMEHGVYILHDNRKGGLTVVPDGVILSPRGKWTSSEKGGDR